VDKEWTKMVTHRVVFAHRPGIDPFPIFIAPLQAVVKQSDIEDALAELELKNVPSLVDPDVPYGQGEDDIIPLDQAKEAVDALNHTLETCGAEARVKVRLCVDNSVTTNPITIPLPMSYAPVDQLLSKLRHLSWLCKVDYRRCFFNIPLHPTMYKYMGQRAPDGTVYMAHRVQFGITTGPHIASILTGETALMIREALRQRLPTAANDVYLDDNGIAADTEEDCYHARSIALEIAELLGWPVAMDKLEEDKPAQQLSYRGVVFDTVAQQLSIPLAKIQCTARRTAALLHDARQGCVQVRRVRSVQGRHGWLSQVMPLGRSYTHATSRCTKGLQNRHMVDLRRKAGVLDELAWWDGFLQSAISQGGFHRWTPFGQPPAAIRLVSDASGNDGFGGYCSLGVLAGLWNQSVITNDHPCIEWKELVPVYLLLQWIAPTLQPGTLVIVTTDNSSNAFALNNGDAKNEMVFEILLAIFQLADRYHLQLVGDWIPRAFNWLCDHFSHLRPLPSSAHLSPQDSSHSPRPEPPRKRSRWDR
jgi:hypothetical protein